MSGSGISGQKLNAMVATAVMCVSGPQVSTKRDNGFTTLMAYESYPSARLQRPLFTMNSAI